MDIEAVAVMVVGLAALATLRLMLHLVGREFEADHPEPDIPSLATLPDGARRPAVYRGTGRQRHLIYFADSKPTTTSDASADPLAAPPMRRAS